MINSYRNLVRPELARVLKLLKLDVTYSSANMMSSNQEVFRPDQFAHLLAGFNSKLKTWREDPFTMTMK